MSKAKLIARSKELQIEVPEGATNPQISDLIKIAEHPNLVKELSIAEEEFEGQKKLTEKAIQDRDAETEKLETANELIIDLEEKLAQATATPEVTKGETYKSKNGTFQFGVKKFRFKGEKYNASEAVKNEELMEELIEAKFNHLKQV